MSIGKTLFLALLLLTSALLQAAVAWLQYNNKPEVFALAVVAGVGFAIAGVGLLLSVREKIAVRRHRIALKTKTG